MIETAPQAFAAAVARYRERTAVVAENGATLTYAALDALRRQAAKALIALGVQHGERIAIWAPNSVEWVVAGLATQAIGAAIVPINTRMRGNEAAYVLQRSGARLLFSVGRFLGQHYPTLVAPQRPDTLAQIVVVEHAEAGDLDWNAFLAHGESIADATLDARIAAVGPDDTLDILFTSGTTGLPKGVVTTHAQNLRAIRAWSACVELSADDRYLIVNPFFHSFGYKVGWLAGLIAGATVLPHAVFDARAILQRIEAERISVLPGPPTLFISLLDDPQRAQTDLSSLRATITGAATIAPALIERIRRDLGFRIVLTGYGLTETCGIATLCNAHDAAETIALTSGKAIPGIELRCVDADGQAVATGESGEIVIRGYNVMQGYLDDPQATRETIAADGWLHTGDVGHLDARGYLRITDRVKDMYISGGFNCYPAEIERMLAAHPAIAQSAVVGVPDARLGEVGKAYVVLRPGQALDAPTLIAWCREQMANYKVPRQVAFADTLPTNASGKVMKFQLRARADAAPAPATPPH
ncbi:FadD3 family acyl-CoA ligase [Solimonas marina]|uniref:AMP-binding protein n=1 Tax=Solimonas marina TaxID=2714601 RepID=A0A970B4S7_9GAMM|nr:AMP-binding protein [Solimonas marina]